LFDLRIKKLIAKKGSLL